MGYIRIYNQLIILQPMHTYTDRDTHAQRTITPCDACYMIINQNSLKMGLWFPYCLNLAALVCSALWHSVVFC